MARGKRNTRAGAPKATDAETGAIAVRKYMIGLFDREDGRAANWPLIADTLFRAAFEALDEIPEQAQPDKLLQSVHEAAYDRIVKNGAESAIAAPLDSVTAPEARGRSLRRDFKP